MKTGGGEGGCTSYSMDSLLLSKTNTDVFWYLRTFICKFAYKHFQNGPKDTFSSKKWPFSNSRFVVQNDWTYLPRITRENSNHNLWNSLVAMYVFVVNKNVIFWIFEFLNFWIFEFFQKIFSRMKTLCFTRCTNLPQITKELPFNTLFTDLKYSCTSSIKAIV